MSDQEPPKRTHFDRAVVSVWVEAMIKSGREQKMDDLLLGIELIAHGQALITERPVDEVRAEVDKTFEIAIARAKTAPTGRA
jgi:hypothetical protein